jgi:uncharacterized membrane protein
MTRMLLVGESWISQSTHFKGFDSFTSTTFHTGGDEYLKVLRNHGIEAKQMYAHEVPEKFPFTLAELNEYDVIVLSDIGANSFLLAPDTWLKGQSQVNRLKLLAEWVLQGGGLLMAGGYLSFMGFQARANYLLTPLADVLPVKLMQGDDRIEGPEGLPVRIIDDTHPISNGVSGDSPNLLGYNKVIARETTQIIAEINGDILLAIHKFGKGKSAVWTSDIGPHWCPNDFIAWPGFELLMSNLITWLGKE